MAKALFGHVGLGADPKLLAEVRRLRGRVAELEAELARLTSEDAVVEAAVVVVDASDRDKERQPALT